MPIAKDLKGLRFERLYVQELSHIHTTPGGYTLRMWRCICDCGEIKLVTSANLNNGTTKSCGCWTKDRATTHGMSKTRFYRTWIDMKDRCDKERIKHYEYYGGRGISYPEKWKDFEGFKEDMFESYSDKLTLERLDPNLGYSKENCDWVTMSVQTKNRRKLSSNKTGVNGVHIQVDSRSGVTYVVGRYTDNITGKGVSKGFSVEKFGYDQAFKFACEFREQGMIKLLSQGAEYSEFHGL